MDGQEAGPPRSTRLRPARRRSSPNREPPGESASLSLTPRYSLAMAIDRSTRSRTFWPVVVTALPAVGTGAVLGLGLVEAAVRSRMLVFADRFDAGSDNVWLVVFAMTMWLGAVAAAVAGPAATALTRAVASRGKHRDVEPAAGTEPGRATSVSALVAGAVGAAAAIPLVHLHAAAAQGAHIVDLRPSPSAVLAYVTGLVLGLAVALAAEVLRIGRAASVGLGVAAVLWWVAAGVTVARQDFVVQPSPGVPPLPGLTYNATRAAEFWLTLLLCAAVGALAAFAARRLSNRVGDVVLAAVIGPATLAASYLLTMIVGPAASGDHDSGLGGPLVALALGSALAAVVGLRVAPKTGQPAN